MFAEDRLYAGLRRIAAKNIGTARAKLPVGILSETTTSPFNVQKQCFATIDPGHACDVFVSFTLTSRKEGEAVDWQGFHAPHMLFILDEAPGLPPAVLNAIRGAIASGDGRIVMLGNPTVPGGPFYEAFGTKRVGWETFTIDGISKRLFSQGRVEPAARADQRLS